MGVWLGGGGGIVPCVSNKTVISIIMYVGGRCRPLECGQMQAGAGGGTDRNGRVGRTRMGGRKHRTNVYAACSGGVVVVA